MTSVPCALYSCLNVQKSCSNTTYVASKLRLQVILFLLLNLSYTNAETALVLGLIFSSPLRELVMRILDIITVGKANLILKTVAATLLLVFTSMLYDVIEIKKCWSEGAVPNPADEILMAKQVLKASMWFALFLALATYGLHYCIKGLEGSRTLKAAEDNKQLMLEPPKINATSSK